jgi:hypothetical protein
MSETPAIYTARLEQQLDQAVSHIKAATGDGILSDSDMGPLTMAVVAIYEARGETARVNAAIKAVAEGQAGYGRPMTLGESLSAGWDFKRRG